ncbi:hypothetical protein [Geosporobacter ferrireducens]|uniref:Uncharacterized protein n=1 Tax=Geosporobacter ferrireducens TaxID=1424294 RepID=A0A1D8GII5_9FIRM|nr:hypothetical protein [Geosporobacter ferrireducens]AOT70708.1 hypothetical protein Gferi_14670 [Geosporobacter ferrireducens]MTI57515.1 hypothetical protein [Geosporobacter ferrireducens]
MKVEIDIRKIFLTPPSTMYERVTLFLVMVITFILFFGPLRFSQIPPLEAGLTAALPALTISWGWIVFLRSVFRKKDFYKK